MLVFGRVIFPKKNIMPRFKVGKSSYSASLAEKKRYKQTILWLWMATTSNSLRWLSEVQWVRIHPKLSIWSHLSFGWILEPAKKTSKKTFFRRLLFIRYIFGPGLSYIFSVSVDVMSGIPSEVLLASKTLHTFSPDENFLSTQLNQITLYPGSLSSWLFQPIWKIIVKLDRFPK